MSTAAESPRTSDVVVQDNPEESRYEALVDGAVAGFALYERHEGLIVFTHTEVDPAYSGHGIGSILVRRSLDDVRTRELIVRPVCPFYKKYIETHPEYADLLGG